MQREEMDRLIEEHIAVERRGDTAAAVAMYTEDVVHDVIGFPTGPVRARRRRRRSTTT
jgi:ketosteroid isomerase-like protein